MRFDKTLREFRRRFPERGVFCFRPGDLIRRTVAERGVPCRPAVYVISAIGSAAEIVYVGKAGTMCNDGTWKAQLLSGRLCNKQGGMSRQEFFGKMLAETRARKLHFEWFVTENERVILPALAEAELLQAFYDDNQQLPRYNACA